MTDFRVLAATARTLTLLAAPAGTRFAQPAPLDWRLLDEDGRAVHEGSLTSAVLFLDGLEPGSRYRLETAQGTIEARTSPCAGLIDARDFGASPGATDNSRALQAAIRAVPEGGTLYLSGGRYVSLPIFLKPAMTLHLAADTTLVAPSDRSLWTQLPARDPNGRALGTWEGLPEASFAALVTALDCPGLAITGRGTIDGGGDRGDWWSWPKETRDGARRPRTLHLAYSDNVSVTGVTIRNSPSWTVHPYRCKGLTFAGLRIENPPDSPNTDGLNPESCEDVAITGVDFSVGDDCIAIKAGKRGGGENDHLAPTRGIAISHCRMQRGHGAVVLGSEMSGGISEVAIRACEFEGTDRGLRLKTRRGRGGVIEAVSLQDTVMSGVATPLAVNAFYYCDPDGKDDWVQNRSPAPVDDTTPQIRDIALTDVTAHGVTLAAAALLGLPEAPVEDVRIERFTVSYDPTASADIPLMADGVVPVRHGGIFAEFAHVTGTLDIIPRDEDRFAC